MLHVSLNSQARRFGSGQTPRKPKEVATIKPWITGSKISKWLIGRNTHRLVIKPILGVQPHWKTYLNPTTHSKQKKHLTTGTQWHGQLINIQATGDAIVWASISKAGSHRSGPLLGKKTFQLTNFWTCTFFWSHQWVVESWKQLDSYAFCNAINSHHCHDEEPWRLRCLNGLNGITCRDAKRSRFGECNGCSHGRDRLQPGLKYIWESMLICQSRYLYPKSAVSFRGNLPPLSERDVLHQHSLTVNQQLQFGCPFEAGGSESVSKEYGSFRVKWCLKSTNISDAYFITDHGQLLICSNPLLQTNMISQKLIGLIYKHVPRPVNPPVEPTTRNICLV